MRTLFWAITQGPKLKGGGLFFPVVTVAFYAVGGAPIITLSLKSPLPVMIILCYFSL